MNRKESLFRETIRGNNFQLFFIAVFCVCYFSGFTGKDLPKPMN